MHIFLNELLKFKICIKFLSLNYLFKENGNVLCKYTNKMDNFKVFKFTKV